jgi:phosphatidylglycerol:prolipoprotein diacylglycerol transferase
MFPRIFTIPAFYLLSREWGPWTLHSYGVLLALAFVAGLWVVSRQARRQGLEPTVMTDLAIYVLIGGLVGAKLLLVVVDWRTYMKNPAELWSVLKSGGVFYGGLLGGMAVGAWYTIRHKIDVWKALDVLAPAVVLGQAIGRFACLAAGCCHGRPTDVAWAVTYRDMYSFRTVGTPIDVPVHPVQIYESLAAIVIFVVLLRMAQRKTFDGQVAIAYVLLYSVARFVVEYYRGDASRGTVFGGLFSTSQFISLALFAGALALLPYLYKKKRIAPPAA